MKQGQGKFPGSLFMLKVLISFLPNIEDSHARELVEKNLTVLSVMSQYLDPCRVAQLSVRFLLCSGCCLRQFGVYFLFVIPP